MNINNNIQLYSNIECNENVDENEYKDEYNSDDISDEEIDDETKQILYNSLIKNNNDYTEISIKINNIKNIKNKKKIKETYNLNEFVNKFTINEELKKTKKFISKRVSEKKENNNIIIIKNDIVNNNLQRNFSPRLPPYNLVKKEKNIYINNVDVNDINLFPLL